MNNKRDQIFIILISVFAASIAIASVLASKIIVVFNLFVPAGVIAYSISFIVSDVISEVWGKKKANQMVFGGFGALFFVLILVQISLIWPQAPFWENDEAFQTILGSAIRIISASFIAYLCSQFHDVWAFHFWKKTFKNRHLWLRNNASTIVSQLIDSTIFITIAFYGVFPVWQMIISQWIIKIAIAFLDTPIVYILIWLIKTKCGAEGGTRTPTENLH